LWLAAAQSFGSVVLSTKTVMDRRDYGRRHAADAAAGILPESCWPYSSRSAMMFFWISLVPS